MVWDGENQASVWSETASFETGLLEREDWKGTWIGQGEDYENQELAPVLVGEFEVADLEQVVCARAYISGLGVFLADMNGQKLSDAFFEPGESDATKTVYYVTYDITNQLISGTNFLTITLGNGQLWYIKMEQRQNLAVIRKMTVVLLSRESVAERS